MKYQLFVIVFLSTLFNCNHLQNKIDDSNTAVLKVDTSKAVVLEYNSKDKKHKIIFENCKNSFLTNEEIEKVEITLDKIIAKQNIRQKELFQIMSKKYPEEKYKLFEFLVKKENYKRQYICVNNEDGEKEVFVNLFCKEFYPFLKDWRKKLVWNYGGGSCFFNFKINFDKNLYYSVWFNAEA